MNKEEFAKFAMALKTYYPRENMLTNNAAMQLWYEQLKDIPYQVAEAFLNKWITTEKWPPTIADIRGGCADITQGEIEDWGNGWAQVEKAIRYYGYMRVEEAYESMDELTREVTKRIGFQNICASDNIQADRANFRMLYEQLAERKRVNRQMNPDVKRIIQENKLLLENNIK